MVKEKVIIIAEAKYKTCIEALQDYLLLQERPTKEILLLEFQQYICSRLDQLDWTTKTQQDRNLKRILPQTYNGKIVDYLERWHNN